MNWSNDVHAADWIAERLHPFAADVGSIVPEGFAAYVRILHRVRDRSGTLDPDQLGALTESLAAHTQRPDSCWFAIWDGYGWLQGRPAIAELEPAGGGDAPADLPDLAGDAARVQIPGRSMLLYEGAIESVARFCGDELTCQSPNLWWPEDRAWCVATEIDLCWTYVGGSRGLADQLLRDERHEASPVEVADPINL
jgi:hypothetical protein